MNPPRPKQRAYDSLGQMGQLQIMGNSGRVKSFGRNYW